MRKLLLLIALLIPVRGYATITVITSGIIGSVDGGDNLITASFDSTGGDMIATARSDLYSTTPCAQTDSKSNSYTSLTTRETTLGSQITISYVAVPTVGTGHTISCASSAGFPTLAYIVFAGTKASSPFDVQNGAISSGNASTLSTGSVTPTENDEVVVAALGHTVASATIDNGFTLAQQKGANSGGCNCFGLWFGYKVQTTAAAVNPQFTANAGTAELSAAIASFKAAATHIPSSSRRRR